MKLFGFEFFGIAQSISSTSLQLHSGTKSDIARRLAATSIQAVLAKSGVLIDLSPIIKSKQFVWGSRSYMAPGYEWCDFVVDEYFVRSLKEMMAPQCSLLIIISSRLTSVTSSATVYIKTNWVSHKLLAFHGDDSSIKFVGNFQIFQKKFHSPGDHRPKYLMA